jgi:hypothetical protein
MKFVVLIIYSIGLFFGVRGNGDVVVDVFDYTRPNADETRLPCFINRLLWYCAAYRYYFDQDTGRAMARSWRLFVPPQYQHIMQSLEVFCSRRLVIAPDMLHFPPMR